MTRKRTELHSTDHEIQQPPPIHMPDEGPVVVETAINAVEAGPTLDKRLHDLKFNEEPVTILVQPPGGQDKNPPRVVDCWVNGTGAEQLINGKWHICGWLPIGKPVTTKRKYVEVLLRSKHDHVSTSHDEANVESPQNFINRNTSSKVPLSILRDANPAGADWLTKVMYDR